jgi:hypothetical protein
MALSVARDWASRKWLSEALHFLFRRRSPHKSADAALITAAGAEVSGFARIAILRFGSASGCAANYRMTTLCLVSKAQLPGIREQQTGLRNPEIGLFATHPSIPRLRTAIYVGVIRRAGVGCSRSCRRITRNADQ